MELKQVNLVGAAGISRVVNVYEIDDFRGVPDGRYKIKVLERVGGFLAVTNFGFKTPEGAVDWVGGLGADERTALQDVLTQVGEALSSKEDWNPDDFEWSDPLDF